MRVFLISSPYIENCICDCFDKFFKVKIEKLLLLYENHPDKLDSISSELPYNILLAENLQEGIQNSDTVIIINSSLISEKFYNKVKKHCHDNTVPIKEFTIEKNPPIESNMELLQKTAQKTPSILMIGINKAAQLFKNELQLKFSFDEINRNLLFLPQYYFKNIKQDIKFFDNNNNNNNNLILHSIDDFKIEYNPNNTSIDTAFYVLKPDYLIVCLEALTINYHSIDKYFYYKYGKHVNAFLKSEYMILNNDYEYIIKLNKDFNNSSANSNYIVLNNKFSNIVKIRDDIIEKLAYPYGVLPIN